MCGGGHSFVQSQTRTNTLRTKAEERGENTNKKGDGGEEDPERGISLASRTVGGGGYNELLPGIGRGKRRLSGRGKTFFSAGEAPPHRKFFSVAESAIQIFPLGRRLLYLAPLVFLPLSLFIFIRLRHSLLPFFFFRGLVFVAFASFFLLLPAAGQLSTCD